MAISRQQLREFLITNNDPCGSYGLSLSNGESYKLANPNIGTLWKTILGSKLEDDVELFERDNSRDSTVMTIKVLLEWKNQVGEFNRPFKKRLISVFQEAIYNLLTAGKSDEDVIIEAQKCCLVTYNTRTKNKLNTGIETTTMRMVFPNLVTTVEVQQKIYQEALIKCCKLNLLGNLDKLPYQLELKNIITIANDNHLQVLLANTYPKYEFYSVIKADQFDLTNSVIEVNELFNLRNHQHVIIRSLDINDLMTSVSERLIDYMPLLLSRNYGIPIRVTYNRQYYRQPNIESIGGGYEYESEYNDIQLAAVFLTLLSPHRFFIRNYFMDVGRALHAVYKGDNEGKNVWFRYAQRAMSGNGSGDPANGDSVNNDVIPDHLRNLDDYANEYVKFMEKDYGIDIRTLAWYAKEDSPDEYHDWQDAWILSAVEKSIANINQRNVATIFYRIVWLTLLAAPDGRNTTWYKYQGSIWRISSNANSVIKIFEDELIMRLELMMVKIKSREQQVQQQSLEAGEQLKPSPYISQLNKIIDKVSTTNFMRGVLTYSAAKLQIEDFYDLIDENVNLTAMSNGVVESSYRTKSIIFRSGKPQDYLTRCTQKAFPVHYTWQSPEVKMYLRWIKEMYHTPELARHYHKLISTVYVGGNLEKIIVFLTGRGNNGKSTVIRCLGSALGNYLSIFPFNLLTSDPPDPSRPCPLLFSLSGPRLSVALESGDKDLKDAVIKVMTGNDHIPARLNFSNDIKMLTPTTTLIAVVNDIPSMRGFDHAIRSRTKIFPNDTTYSATAPEDKAMQRLTRTYPRVSTFIESVSKLAQAALWVSYQFFPIYADKGMVDPPEIIKATEQYWKDTDIYAMFIDEKLEAVYNIVDGVKKKDDSVELSVDAAYNAFNVWYMERYPNQHSPNRNNFTRYMLDDNRVGKSVNRCWPGLRLIDKLAMTMMNVIGNAVGQMTGMATGATVTAGGWNP